jgi:RHH-type transcriptional regulator, proline utilization regulon repressor / proline dehydrogenase / delta 1-pyrroline-5-carboxylate dehydrogenase
MIDAEKASANPFKRNDFYGRLLEWSMQDEGFKTQMFRFVDVLPTLTSSHEVVEHLAEYLSQSRTSVSGLLRGALTIGKIVPILPAAIIRQNVLAMANLFIAGRDGRSALPNLERLWREGTRFTVDILGEGVVSEREADQYAARYDKLLSFLGTAIRNWQVTGPLAATEPPLLNVSVKISALCARIRASDPASSLDAIMRRLLPIAMKARDLNGFINLDMESYSLKGLTLELFRRLVERPELDGYPHLGFALQAYLRDSYEDAERMLDWAARNGHRFTVRLVKGAYWDYEKVIAGQRAWPVPVYLSKPETDVNYERITRLLLEHSAQVYPALATHNVRTIAHALVHGEKLGLKPGDGEFQMLYGMATPIQRALVRLGQRVREYCPVGELVPGMAYLVRRLLENTSNEGFLRAKFGGRASAAKLLEDPATQLLASSGLQASQTPVVVESRFRNEAPANFTLEAQRNAMVRALEKVGGELGRSYPLIIGGRAVHTAQIFPSVNPAAPGQQVGQIATAQAVDVTAAVQAARAAFPNWVRSTPDQRARLLQRVAGIMQERRAELAAWEVIEVGKTWGEADADVVEAIDFCEFYAREMQRLGRGRLTQEVPGEISIEHYVPRGVAAVIAPWNFPLAILCGMTTAALVAGNTVVVKPAEQSSVVGALFVNMLREAGAPEGTVNLLTGQGEITGAGLVADPDVDLIAFTGSREVGVKIWETAGKTHPRQRNLKKVICEMGGKNAIIVDGDADLDETVLAVVQSAFGFQGQKCSALSRLITVGDAGDRLLPRLIEATAALKVGLPADPGTDLGPVIDLDALTRINSYRELARREHRILFEGEIPKYLEGYFVPPLIAGEVPPGARLAQEEIFGPILAVIPARDLTEALTIANGAAFALTGGIFSRSPRNIERVRREFSVGNLYVNRGITGAIVGRHPFGGFLMSGGGTKAGGHDYLLNFMFPRVITENTVRRGFAPDSDEAAVPAEV